MRQSQLFFLFGVMCVGFLAGGCAGPSYTIGKEKFSSAEQALQRQSEILAAALDKVTAATQPVHGRALVLLPSDAEIRRHYIRTTGNAALLKADQLDYVGTYVRNDNQCVADAIKKRAIFDSVTIQQHDGNPGMSAFGDSDYLVYRDVDGWFFKGKNDRKAFPIQGDVNHILDSIEYVAGKSSTTSP